MGGVGNDSQRRFKLRRDEHEGTMSLEMRHWQHSGESGVSGAERVGRAPNARRVGSILLALLLGLPSDNVNNAYFSVTLSGTINSLLDLLQA